MTGEIGILSESFLDRRGSCSEETVLGLMEGIGVVPGGEFRDESLTDDS